MIDETKLKALPKITMKKPGAIALGDLAAKATHIEVACSRCPRRGRYAVAHLVAQYGADFPMPDLGAELAQCPHRNEVSQGKRCDIFYPGLAKIMQA